MAFPPHQGPHQGNEDDTAVLPPIEGEPILVRPYVQSAEPAAAEPEPAPPVVPAPMTSALVVPEPRQPVEDAGLPDMLPAEAAPEATAYLPVPLLPVTAPVPAPARPAGGRAEARRTGRQRSRTVALVGGALALAVIGTVAALLTSPSSPSTTQAGAPGPAATLGSPASTPTSAASSRAHSPKPSASAKPTHPSAASTTHKAAPPPSTPATRQSTPQSTTLQLGSTGPAVAALQQDLRTLGLVHGKLNQGVYDDRTASAVVKFQYCAGVYNDPLGTYGPATQAAMAKAMQDPGNWGC